ncbi:MAG: hypothetical protein BWY83_00658 [bacterium ADurb.Bin478]|nr:MAG: hypothetical protein BWY83_00658 [bacterium ADurb.Bin478]
MRHRVQHIRLIGGKSGDGQRIFQFKETARQQIVHTRVPVRQHQIDRAGEAGFGQLFPSGDPTRDQPLQSLQGNALHAVLLMNEAGQSILRKPHFCYFQIRLFDHSLLFRIEPAVRDHHTHAVVDEKNHRLARIDALHRQAGLRIEPLEAVGLFLHQAQVRLRCVDEQISARRCFTGSGFFRPASDGRQQRDG